MTNPFYDPYQVLTAVYANGAHLKIALAQTPIEELNRARTVKTVYGVLENDGYLSLCIRTFAPKNPKQAVRILLKIALYHLVFLQKPRYFVTDLAVELCKKLGKGGMAGFLNAFLRAFDKSKVVIPKGIEGLAVESNFPLFAVKKIQAQYGARAREIMLARSSGISVRFEKNEAQYLDRAHLKTPFEGNLIFERFARDEGFDRGDYTFQSVGSIAICHAVAPCENFLDSCSAPGGKSVLLSKKCQNITACELHAHRVELIKAYCARMRVKNVRAMQGDSTLFRPEWEERFDGVLCDVPCSGLGTVSENPDLPLGKTEQDFLALLSTQRAILQNCSRYVKKSGALYYSTCSILEEENDGAVQDFLAKNQEFTVEEIDSPLVHEKGKYGLQFLPDTAYGAGFYVAKLRRK